MRYREVEITLDLRDTRGQRLHDEVGFQLFADGDPKTRVARAPIHGAPIALEFRFRSDALNPRISVAIRPRRFKRVRTRLTRLDEIPADPIAPMLVRRPDKFRPRFQMWNDLPGSFDRLKKVLERSPRITVIGDRTIPGTFTGPAYDKTRSRTATYAKAALLNLFAKMETTRPPEGTGRASWFPYVQKILRIGRERFIAIVDDRMFEDVKTAQRSSGYDDAPSDLHRKNIPPRYRVVGEFPSAKSTEEPQAFANLQLTIARVVDKSGNRSTILDVDIDESAGPIEHFIDVAFVHPITGGTNPYLVHDLLGYKLGFRNLGYRLVPKR